MDSRRFLFLLLLSALSLPVLAKGKVVSPSEVRFRSPLDIPILLSGNFGEIRSNHFHTGIDIATEGREGLDIHACEDGYVSRIRVGPYGYGKAIYITHNNGYTTVYGHLREFVGDIGGYVESEQYRRESFEIDMQLGPHDLPVSKGDVVALSGNSGSSGGPHLHFEVRQGETPMNPLNFGFKVADSKRPEATRIYFYPVFEKAPVQKPISRSLLGSAGKLRASTKVVLGCDRVGIGIDAFDRQDGRNNRNGIYRAELWVDEELRFTFQMDSLSFREKRYLNAHSDVEESVRNRRKLHRLFRLPGNGLSLYPEEQGDGFIRLDSARSIQVKLWDHAGNLTTASAQIEPDSIPAEPSRDYIQALEWYKDNYFYSEELMLRMPDEALYDDLWLQYESGEGKWSSIHYVHEPFIQLHQEAELSIKTEDLPEPLIDRALIVHKDHRGRTRNMGGHWEDGYLKTRTDRLGTFYVTVDTLPPVIHTSGWKSGQNLSRSRELVFKISDNLSGVVRYRVEVDGQWILMDYDAKRNRLAHRFDDRIGKGRHELRVMVEDERGNRSERNLWFVR